MAKQDTPMKKLTPDDFRFQLLDHAHMLRRSYIARNKSGYALEGAMWVIRREAWLEFRLSPSALEHIKMRSGVNELFGLPVRITVDDSDDTPMIQLVMEPVLKRRS
jgi:hypothetical protein